MARAKLTGIKSRDATAIEDLESGQVAAAVQSLPTSADQVLKAFEVIRVALAKRETAHAKTIEAAEESEQAWREKYDTLQRASDAAIREAENQLVAQKHSASQALTVALDMQRLELEGKHAATVDKLERDARDYRAATTAKLERITAEAADAAKAAAEERAKLQAKLEASEATLRKVQGILS